VVLDAPKLADLAFQHENPFFDVMPDGDHFVVLLTPRVPSPTHYNIVTNWLEEVSRKLFAR
jgi:hypothetical protein